jgi:hypothetical protein
MQGTEKGSKRALRQSPVARKSQVINLAQRLAFSPREAGVLVGKSGTYIYRQIYSGRIKPISDCGRMMIPRAELDRFLSRTAEYNGHALNRTALLHRTQKMAKGPVGCGRPLSPCHFVGGAEVDSLIDTDIDDITSRIGKAMIDLRCVWKSCSSSRRSFDPRRNA